MFRFTIRDVLWLTVVVAFALGWWLEFRRSPTRQLEFRAKAMKSAIEGVGYKVEQPTPFTIKLSNPRTVISISAEESTADADPFGPAQHAGIDPFGTGDPFTAK